MFDWLKPKKQFKDFDLNLSREEIIRRSRLLVIDDERPEIIKDMEASNFAVDYLPDVTRQDISKIDQRIYDLILLDFGGVGKDFGDDEGLSLLKHIKRVNPAVIVLAYTSKALFAQQADFFRDSDGVLEKDAGISESLERIEESLKDAHSFKNTWQAILKVTGIQAGSTKDIKLQNAIISATGDEEKVQKVTEEIATLAKGTSKALVVSLIVKLFELLALAWIA